MNKQNIYEGREQILLISRPLNNILSISKKHIGARRMDNLEFWTNREQRGRKEAQ